MNDINFEFNKKSQFFILKAASFLRKATKCGGDPSVAYLGLMKCVPNDEVPDVCEKYLKHAPYVLNLVEMLSIEFV